MPLYVRDKVAHTTAEREVIKAEKLAAQAAEKTAEKTAEKVAPSGQPVEVQNPVP